MCQYQPAFKCVSFSFFADLCCFEHRNLLHRSHNDCKFSMAVWETREGERLCRHKAMVSKVVFWENEPQFTHSKRFWNEPQWNNFYFILCHRKQNWISQSNSIVLVFNSLRKWELHQVNALIKKKKTVSWKTHQLGHNWSYLYEANGQNGDGEVKKSGFESCCYMLQIIHAVLSSNNSSVTTLLMRTKNYESTHRACSKHGVSDTNREAALLKFTSYDCSVFVQNKANVVYLYIKIPKPKKQFHGVNVLSASSMLLVLGTCELSLYIIQT